MYLVNFKLVSINHNSLLFHLCKLNKIIYEIVGSVFLYWNVIGSGNGGLTVYCVTCNHHKLKYYQVAKHNI